MELISNWPAMRERYNLLHRVPGEAEMTQTRLGHLLGKSRQEVNRYERGVRLPPFELIVRAAQILHCETEGQTGTNALYLHAANGDSRGNAA